LSSEILRAMKWGKKKVNLEDDNVHRTLSRVLSERKTGGRKENEEEKTKNTSSKHDVSAVDKSGSDSDSSVSQLSSVVNV